MGNLKKCYLASKDVRYGMYRGALNRYYKYIMVDYLEDAQLICVPVERSGITYEQKMELIKAQDLGIDIMLISGKDLMVNEVDGLKQKPEKVKDREHVLDMEI